MLPAKLTGRRLAQMVHTHHMEGETLPALRRLAVVCAAAGAGFAITLACIWQISHWAATRPRPWDRAALTAKFEKAECATDWFYEHRPITLDPSANIPACQLAIRFLVTNHTSSDVEVQHDSELLTKASDSGALDLDGAHGPRVSRDVFIPTGQSAALQIITLDRCEKHDNNWAACFKEDFAGTRELVILIKERRYEIDLPLR